MAKFTIDQATLPAGTEDRSRTDGLDDGSLVTLSRSGTQDVRFRLLWVPPGDTTAVATLAEQSPGIWTFTPTNLVYGTYRIEMIQNEGKSNEERSIRWLVVRTPAGLCIPPLNGRASDRASLVNADAVQVSLSEDNSQDWGGALDALDYSGWWRAMHQWIIAAGGGGSSLQSSYAVGNTITTSAANGDFEVLGTESATISVDTFLTLNGATGIGLTSSTGNINIASTVGFATLEADNDVTVRSNSNDLFLEGQQDLTAQSILGNTTILSNAGFLTMNGNTGIGMTSATGNINLTSSVGFATIESDNVAALRSNSAAATVEGATGINLIVGAVSWTWPTADGTSGQILSTNGAGVLDWADDTSGEPSQGASGILNYSNGSGGWTASNLEVSSNAIFVGGSISINAQAGQLFLEGTTGVLTQNDFTVEPGATPTLIIDSTTAASVVAAGVLQWNGVQNTYIAPNDLAISQFNADMDAQNNDIDNVKTVTFNSVIAAGNMGAAETLDWTAGQKQSGTNSANCTISFTNPAGPCNLMFVLTNGGAFSLTWPGSVEWPGGTEPSWTAAGVDVISFYFDGTTYFGMAGLDFS